MRALTLSSNHRRLLALAGGLIAVAGLICYLSNLLFAVSIVAVVLLFLFFLARTREVLLLFLLLRSSLDISKNYFSVYLSDTVEITGAIVLSFVLIIGGMTYLVANRKSFLRPPLAGIFLIFLAIAMIHFLLVEDLRFSLMEFTRYFSAYLVYLLVWDLCRNRSDRRMFVNTILLSSLIPIGAGLYQGLLNRGEYITGFMRAYGTFAHPEPYAFYLILILALALNLFFYYRRRRQKLLLIGLILAALACILFTFTRTAWFGCLMIIFIAACFRQKKLIWIFIALILVFSLLSPLRSRFYDLSTSFNSLAYRLSIWRGGLEQMSGILVLGRGLGSFAKLDVLGELAHNDYLRLIFEVGLLGFIAHLILSAGLLIRLAVLSRAELERYHHSIVLAALSVAIFFMAAGTINNLVFRTVLQWYFWALMAIALRSDFRESDPR